MSMCGFAPPYYLLYNLSMLIEDPSQQRPSQYCLILMEARQGIKPCLFRVATGYAFQCYGPVKVRSVWI